MLVVVVVLVVVGVVLVVVVVVGVLVVVVVVLVLVVCLSSCSFGVPAGGLGFSPDNLSVCFQLLGWSTQGTDPNCSVIGLLAFHT